MMKISGGGSMSSSATIKPASRRVLFDCQTVYLVSSQK